MVDDPTARESGALVAVNAGNAGGLLAVMHGGDSGVLDVPKPFAQPICLVDDTRVAGTTHVEGIDELVRGLQEGDRLGLERDPSNKHDRWCIRVLDGQGRRLGFVPADVNQIPARLMDGGKRLFAKVTEVELRGGWRRIGMEVWLDD